MVGLGDIVLREEIPTEAGSVSHGGLSLLGTICLFRSGCCLSQVTHGAKKHISIVMQQSNTAIAAPTQQPTNSSRRMVVVNSQGRGGLTNGTNTPLFDKKGHFYFRSNAVQTIFSSDFKFILVWVFPHAEGITSITVTMSFIQPRRTWGKVSQWLYRVTPRTFFFKRYGVRFSVICSSCFYCTRFSTKEKSTLSAGSIDFTVGFFNRNTTAGTNYGRCRHVFDLLLFFLRSVPIRRPAFRTSENLILARHPLVTTAQALQFFDLDFHTGMDTIENSREQQERRAAILQSVSTDCSAA